MVQVGVTGHRRLVPTEGLERAIDEALGRIASALSGPLTFVSPLAEGADQLVVRRAFALGHRRLIVPLPLPKNDYLRTFASADAGAELLRLLAQADEVVVMGQASTDVEAYHAVGRWVLDHADVLVAVWNGRPPRGKAGTGAIVEEARARGLPMAWIHADQGLTRADRLAASRRREVVVTYERL
ncbi:MAG: hypothetical protein A3I61_03710 [Acidobacteria bacterium RIFCSPLOWO2_02_FULL_68_18]|nr:MAG: hypothetical protein A3I61_03710 [Acidobacteria bacterium RIFCSPLOWO2_02_FULL_68_18]